MSVDLGKSKVAVELLATNPYLQFETAVETLRKYVSNIVEKPDEPKYRKIRLQNATFDRNVRQPRGGIRFLESIGFHEVNGFLELDAANPEQIQQALDLLLAKLQQMKDEEQRKIDAERAEADALRLQRQHSRERKVRELEEDKERRRDPTWRPQVAAGANKGGRSVTGFADVGVDLNAGGG
jgi:hypothetical protein